MDREDDVTKVKLVLNWETPPLVAGNHNAAEAGDIYIVRVNRDCYNAADATCAEIRLRADDDVYCSVYLDTSRDDQVSSSVLVGSRATVDMINTVEQRLFSESFYSIVLP